MQVEVAESSVTLIFMSLYYLSIPKFQRLHRWSLGMDK